jgi:kumamolisin
VSSPEITHAPVPGSTRTAPRGAFRIADADVDAPVEVTLVVRRPADQITADPYDLDAVHAFADVHNLDVVAAHPEARAVTLSGSVADVNTAFRVDLGTYAHEGRVYRGREGDVHIPVDLDGVVVAVLGLDERAQARTPHRTSPRATSGYTPNAVAQRYGFPATADGTGQTIAVIELGGGYRASDLTAYFKALGLRVPTVTAVGVGGATNAPGKSSADVEVALDIQVIGAVAQGANIVVYFGPNTDAGFYQVLATAINDTARKPSIVSISWGGPESSWTSQAMASFDALFADAATLGITVLAAAGDNGSSDGTNSPAVDFPASSPHVVACGGTTLTATTETVWNETSANEGATGGGVSQFFAKPSYQGGVNVPAAPNGFVGRGVPDVAGNADPVSGYEVMINGQMGIVGGTSAVAPLWAGLVALSNQINGSRAGMPHVALYAAAAEGAGAFVDITSGGNGSYQAGPGWDACTGNGTPIGSKVVAALAPVQAAPPPPPVTPPPVTPPPVTPPPVTPPPVVTPPASGPVNNPALVALLVAFDSHASASEAAYASLMRADQVLQDAVATAIAALNAEG